MWYAETGGGDVGVIHGHGPGMYRIRVRDWRTVFRRTGETITVLEIGHRSEVYKR